MEKISKKELDLVEQLKNLCTNNGKEKKENIKKTADIFNQLGNVYSQKKPERIRLIQSAALLNAAIVRQPLNEQLHQDLCSLCSHVLKVAKAKYLNANLTEISNAAAELILQMRQEAKSALSTLKNISYEAKDSDLKRLEQEKILHVQLIQNKITDDYTKIMHFISERCIEIMGSPPCMFALVGMGSLAKKEVTPYSDFEHIIILEEGIQDRDNYNEVIEYFRWYSTIFIIVLVNLKETILRFLTIPLLNDVTKPKGDWFYDAFTPCGISPDGFQPAACKMPLGRTQKTEKKPWTTELIRPVSEMVSLLQTDVALKNGYHLFDILTKTCFVSGNESVHDEFVVMVKKALLKNQFDIRLLDQLADDLRNFDTFTNLHGLMVVDSCDIKRIVYRSTTLYISALGRLQAIDVCSCFDIIDSLHKQGVINDETSHRLSYAVAVACQIRLQVYMSKEGQEDFLQQECFDDVTGRKMTTAELINLVGERSVADYFYIAYGLQTTFKNPNVLENLNKYLKCNDSTRFTMLSGLNFHERIIKEWEENYMEYTKQMSVEEISLMRYHVARAHRMKLQHDSALTLFRWIADHEIQNLRIKGWAMVSTVKCLSDTNCYKEALESANEVRPEVEKLNVQKTDKYHLLSILVQTCALSHLMLGQYHKAIEFFEEEFSFCSVSGIPVAETRKAECLVNMAVCYNQLRDPFKAMNKAQNALVHFKAARSSIALVSNCYCIIGQSYAMQGRHHEALEYFEESLKMRKEYLPVKCHTSDERIKLLQSLSHASEMRVAHYSKQQS